MALAASKTYRPPPYDDETFSLQWALEDVRLAVWGFEQGFLPFAGGLFDQPKSLLDDMVAWMNARESVKKEGGVYSNAPINEESYEEQSKTGLASVEL